MAIDVNDLPPINLTKIRQQKLQNTASNTQKKDSTNGAKVLLGWLLMLVFLAVLTRTRYGYVIVYYILWLGVITIILATMPQIGELLSLVKAPDGPSAE